MNKVTRAAMALAALGLCLPILGAPRAAHATNAAGQFAPGVIFDFGGRFDKSFNEGVAHGMDRFKAETGLRYHGLEITNDAQREQYMRKLAQHGADIIIAVGFSQVPAVEKMARAFPDVKFTIIDGRVDLPNVQSISFAEQDGSYLVGMLAAMTSRTGTIGFIGGVDIPLIRRFACGYEQGARSIRPDEKILVNMAGSTPAAWADPTRGGELAKSQYDRGADVIFAAAGQTGMGVLQAAKDAGKYAIGVDSNQNGLFPGYILTSMLKRVDIAAYQAVEAAYKGTWEPGVHVLGLKEDGVGWALDENNRKLVTPDMEARITQAADEIKAGTRAVADYSETAGCVY